MLSRTSFIVAVLAVMGMGSVTSAAHRGTQVVYIGGHDPARITRADPKPGTAPYALTGSETTGPKVRYEEVRVGSRIVGFQRVTR